MLMLSLLASVINAYVETCDSVKPSKILKSVMLLNLNCKLFAEDLRNALTVVGFGM